MPAKRKLSILLLDDQTLVRAGIRMLVQDSEPRAQIHEARSYDEALAQLAAATPIDVAFLDIDLRETHTGIDVLKHIRASKSQTRVIMLSASDEEAVILDCIHLGASGYIQKDMDTTGLFRNALDTIFQGAIFLPAGILGRESHSSATAKPASTTTLAEIGVRGRAVEVLYYICQGLPNALIAQEMGVTEHTVANEYNSKLFRLFRVTNRARLIVEVARRGIIPPQPVRGIS
jgi:two-component system, NarL family, nitrate/nitrite response regulator NarL